MHFSMLLAGAGGSAFAPAEKTELCSLTDWLQLKTFLQVLSPRCAGVAKALFVLLNSSPQMFL